MKEFFSQVGEVLRTELFRLGETPVSVFTVGTVLLILLFTLWLSKSLRRLTTKLLAHRNRGAAGTVGAVVHYLTLITGFAIALSTAGINLTALFAAGAIFAAGLGFAMKSIVENFVAGIILLTERTIKPGDIVEVEGMLVKVLDMGIRASIVRSRDGEDIIIPNSLLSQNAVKNYTLRDSVFRIRVPVGVVYGSDMKLVRETLAGVADSVSERWGVSGHKPLVVMTEFGNHSVNWEVGVWMNDPWEYRPALSDLHESIWWAFQERGIVIAFPQLDLHLDPPVAKSLQALAQRAS